MTSPDSLGRARGASPFRWLADSFKPATMGSTVGDKLCVCLIGETVLSDL